MSGGYLFQIIVLELLCVLILFSRYKCLFSNLRNKHTKYFSTWLFLTVFCVWFSWGYDYFAYPILLQTKEHVEPIYTFLFSVLGENYILWRFVVWGISNIFVILTYKNIGANRPLDLLIFILLPLLQFYCITRNSLGLSVLFYALSILENYGRKSIVKVIFLLVLASFLHRSMPIYILFFAIVAFVPFTKPVLLLSLCLFPLLKGGILLFSEDILALFGNEDIQNSGVAYIQQDNELNFSIFGIIHQIVEFFPIILVMVYSIRSHLKSRVYYSRFLFYSYILIYISFLFWGQGSAHLHARFWDSSYIPLAFFLSIFLSERRHYFVVKLFMISSLFYFLWGILYNIYSI